MSFTNSTPFAGPFGCAVPGFTPNFHPAFNPSTPNAWVPFNGSAPSPFFTSFSNSPSPIGWNPTPWFGNPVSYSVGSTSPAFSANSGASNDPAWFNNFNTNNPGWFNGTNANNPAWFGHFAPAHVTNESPNTPFAAQPAWSAYGWNPHNSFGPWGSSFAPSVSSTPWFANPTFHQPTNPAQFQAFTPWFAPAFGGSSWFAPHNWTNAHVNPAWAQPGTPMPNSNHANPTPYAVATPPNATAARDAA